MNIAAEIVKLRIAAQVAPRTWQRSLQQLIADLESGNDWEQALNKLGASKPDLGSLLQAAGQAGQPAEITLEIIRQRNIGRVAWHRFMASLVYPLGMLALALIVASIVSMSLSSVLTEITTGWNNFDWTGMAGRTAKVQDLYHASMGGLIVVAWFSLFSSTVYFAASPGARLKLIGSIPYIGRIYRWLALSELLMRLSVFSRHQPELRSALQLTALSFGRNPLAAITNYVAQRVDAGEGLQNALHSTIVSDSRSGLALTLIEKESIGPSAGLAGRLLEQMVEMTCARLSLIIPPLILFAFASIIWGTWISFADVLSGIMNALA